MTPITEAQVEAALNAWLDAKDYRRDELTCMRAALEAAAPLAPPDAAVEAAVLAEREACAKIIERYCLMDSGGEKFLRPRSDGDVNGLAYAAAIRARSAAPRTEGGR